MLIKYHNLTENFSSQITPENIMWNYSFTKEAYLRVNIVPNGSKMFAPLIVLQGLID